MVKDLTRMLTLLGAKAPSGNRPRPDPLRRDLELINHKVPQDKKARLSYLQVRTNGDFKLAPR